MVYALDITILSDQRRKMAREHIIIRCEGSKQLPVPLSTHGGRFGVKAVNNPVEVLCRLALCAAKRIDEYYVARFARL